MKLPAEQKPPRYVTCCCQHCDGHIEFDANQLTENNSNFPCPHCGLETKLFVPQQVTVPADTEPPMVRREGFSCGDPVFEAKPPSPAEASVIRPQSLTEEQINSIGERRNDAMAAKLYAEGDQDMSVKLEDARRYVRDLRFKLMNPETGERFTPETLEMFITARQGQSRKSKVVVLTKDQRKTPLAKELVGLLIEIEREGFGTDAGVRRLNKWLEVNADSEIPAVGYLLEITKTILRFGNISPEDAAKMQNAIVRVLPRSIQIREINSQEFSETLPARKSILKRIRDLGGNPWPGITRAEAYALVEKLQSQPSQRQIEYIQSLGGSPTLDMTRWDASDLIEELLASAKATERQLQFIRDLGGNPPEGISRAGAEVLISQLLVKQRESFDKEQPPTPRQVMVLRFWNRMDLASTSKWEVTNWLSQFYAEDSRRLAAWEMFKAEIGDDGSQRDPSFVPIGTGMEYLKKTTA